MEIPSQREVFTQAYYVKVKAPPVVWAAVTSLFPWKSRLQWISNQLSGAISCFLWYCLHMFFWHRSDFLLHPDEFHLSPGNLPFPACRNLPQIQLRSAPTVNSSLVTPVGSSVSSTVLYWTSIFTLFPDRLPPLSPALSLNPNLSIYGLCTHPIVFCTLYTRSHKIWNPPNSDSTSHREPSRVRYLVICIYRLGSVCVFRLNRIERDSQVAPSSNLLESVQQSQAHLIHGAFVLI